MNESENYKFKLPSRDSEDIADINDISDNFRIADQILKGQEVELGKKIEGSVATEISNNSKGTEFPPASLVFEEVSGLSISFDRKIAEVKDENESQKDFISALYKRITNLEQAIVPSPFETDSSVAYQKEVPENALPYAEVKKIGGMTRKCTNLIPYPYRETTKTLNGVTWTVGEDGKISVSGTPTDNSAFYISDYYIPLNGVSALSLSMNGIVSNVELYVNLYDKDKNSLASLAILETKVISLVDYPLAVSYMVYAKRAYNNVECSGYFYPMLNEGDTALPYEPYFDGLRSAPVTEVESVGANLIPYPYYETSKTTYGITLTINDDGGITINGTATNFISFVLWDTKDFNVTKGVLSGIPTGFGSNFTLRLREVGANDIGRDYGDGLYFETSAKNVHLSIAIQSGTTLNNVTIYPMLNKGSTALPYSPYVRNTLPIPAEVQALDGYGEGVNESVYNYIDWEKKQFVKRVGKVDMGTLNWIFSNANLFHSTTLGKIGLNLICSNYAFAGVVQTGNDEAFNKGNKLISIYNKDRRVYVRDDDYTDAVAFKAAMAGAMLYYELATPIIIDISNLLPEDNFIGVEGNGTLTFKNEYEYDVPSEVTYQIKGANV